MTDGPSDNNPFPYDLRKMVKMKLAVSDNFSSLSDREKDCLLLLGTGHAPKEIAHELNLSPRTVESHLINIRSKLKVRSKPELIQRIFNESESA